MKEWTRRIRGALGMGMSWALAWFGAGMVLLLIVGLDAADVPFPLGFGLLGFLAGVTFSGVLAITGRRRTFGEISMPRFVLWGGIGGLVFGVGFVFTTAALGAASLDLLGMSAIFALAGAGSAAGSLALARMAEDRPSLDASGNMAQVGPPRRRWGGAGGHVGRELSGRPDARRAAVTPGAQGSSGPDPRRS